MNYYKQKIGAYPVFEWLETGILLCIAGGFLDAYTFVTRGGVFCNAQTSNLIFLTLGIASGDGTAALRYLIPVLLFIAGVFLSELCLHLARKKREEFRGHGFVLLGEIAVLVAVGFLPPSVPDMLVNALVSLAAAVQFDNFRKMEGKPFATAFCTGNMRTATEHAMHAAAEKDRAAAKVTAKYALLICAFLCGVLAGYYASQAAGGYAAFIAAAILAAVFAGILLGERARRRLEQQPTNYGTDHSGDGTGHGAPCARQRAPHPCGEREGRRLRAGDRAGGGGRGEGARGALPARAEREGGVPARGARL